MRLFLTSSGISGLKKEFIKLAGNPKGLKCGFVPTAAIDKNKIYVKFARKEITDLGMELIEIDLRNKSDIRKLSDCDVIYVNGGNTFYLLKWIRKSGFDKKIKTLLKKGVVYVGVSAGSYVACPNIEAAKWKHLSDPNFVKIKNLKALNLVNFLIVAHYTNRNKKDVENGVKITNYPVVVLTDKQAVCVKNNKIKVVGKEKKLIFGKI